MALYAGVGGMKIDPLSGMKMTGKMSDTRGSLSLKVCNFQLELTPEYFQDFPVGSIPACAGEPCFETPAP